ncbi:radical SAM protein [Phreatobacter oligotrophus]|uniref:radical SAM protein n=1 Tax=Phreatobacter oligotrophus TaxID=1122261 RepID=UPI002353BC45|nr:radical SAM protein [Phreatobacter oligotrophus]MBX9990838.1 radical SAM protein [Phreatobacter oligotrophus]
MDARRGSNRIGGAMDYDVEADWQLLDTCNYRCGYCFFDAERLGRKLRPAADAATWEAAFALTGRRWLLHITGGEPSLYPELADLVLRLSQRHHLSFNTNLTGPAIGAMAQVVDPARVSFINAGLHPFEQARHAGRDRFLKNLDLLQERGFRVFVSVVATPAVLADFDAVQSLVAPSGLVVVPKALRAVVDGRRYPDAYTEAERATFRARSAEARRAYSAMLGEGEQPSIDVFADEAILHGEPEFRGWSCAAGSRFVRIETDGTVYRCGETTRLGNLLDGSLRLLGGPRTCDTSFCFYFCQKYAVPSAPGLMARMQRWAGLA